MGTVLEQSKSMRGFYGRIETLIGRSTRKKDSAPQEPVTVTNQSIIIQFPNQVRCELKMDIKGKDFSSLLNQLRLLC